MSFIKELVLIVSLHGSKFAIGAENLVEVSEGLEASYSDDVEGFLGTVHFRGEDVKLFNIEKRLNLEGDNSKKSDFVVVHSGNENIAFPVDSVEGVIEIKEEALPFPEYMLIEEGLFTSAYNLNGEFVLSLNIDSLLNPDMPAA